MAGILSSDAALPQLSVSQVAGTCSVWRREQLQPLEVSLND
jgi:hypothetical protein